MKMEHFKESIKNYQTGTDMISGKQINLKDDIEIDGKSALILELKS
jgi:hypothetical protein